MPYGQVNEFDVEGLVSIAGGFPGDNTVATPQYTETFISDAFGEALGFNTGTARTPWLFGGDGLRDPASGWMYHLARFPGGGRGS